MMQNCYTAAAHAYTTSHCCCCLSLTFKCMITLSSFVRGKYKINAPGSWKVIAYFDNARKCRVVSITAPSFNFSQVANIKLHEQ